MSSLKKKSSNNGYLLYIKQVQDELASKGIHKQLSEMADYCSEGWKNKSSEEKAWFKTESKRQHKRPAVKYTSIGEKVENVERRLQEAKSQSDSMYQYIEELVHVALANFHLARHKFIFIYINSYTCESEGFYFPAEITMVEFSLDKGLIRTFHQLLGFDTSRTKAPRASAAEINNHAKNYHLISQYSKTKLPDNYTDILLKIIGFIIQKDVNENVLNDHDLDMPPIYTAHNTIGNELLTTTSSLYQLYQSAVKNPQKSQFNKLFKVYHLDKLFLEMKNVSYKMKHPEDECKALPSVAMATENLSKDMLNVIRSIGCSFHEKNEKEFVCSNFYACKWIYIISIHCCQYFDVQLIPGCHFNFELSSSEFPLETIETKLEKLNISKTYDFELNVPKENAQILTVNSFPALEGGISGLSTSVKKTWSRPQLKMKKTLSNIAENFPVLDSSTRSIQENLCWSLRIRNGINHSVRNQISRTSEIPTEEREFSHEEDEK